MTAAVVLLFPGGWLRRRAGAAAPLFSRAGASWRVRPGLMLALAVIGPVLLAMPRAATAADPEFTQAYLNDPAHIAQGKQLFKQQCALCHGHLAYPGKAPYLKPKALSPDDIYARITYGYGKMPAWEDVFTDEERMAITAYLKSPNFSN